MTTCQVCLKPTMGMQGQYGLHAFSGSMPVHTSGWHSQLQHKNSGLLPGDASDGLTLNVQVTSVLDSFTFIPLNDAATGRIGVPLHVQALPEHPNGSPCTLQRGRRLT